MCNQFLRVRFFFLVTLIFSILATPIIGQSKQDLPIQKKKQPIDETQETSENSIDPTSKKKKLEKTESKPFDFEAEIKKELGDTNNFQAQPKKRPGWVWQFLRTILTLSVLLGIFYGGYQIYRFRQSLPNQNLTAIQTLYEYPLSSGKSLTIIEMGNKLLVLGISDAGIQNISEISDRNQIDSLKLKFNQDNSEEKPDFILELSKAISNKIGKITKTGFSKSFLENPGDKNQINSWRETSQQKLEEMKKIRQKMQKEGMEE